MSGIVGTYRPGAPAVRAELPRMAETIAHRGRDGMDLWNDGPVGFGHVMLCTTPESLRETLPSVSPDGDLAITADARIDNRDELLASVGRSARPGGEMPDSELIMAAYQKWGERCVEHLLGDFAFAIWDKRRQTLFCARDHFGVKPFVYYSCGSVFAFASEIKALLCLPYAPRQLDEVRVGDYLTSTFDDTGRTFYQDIRRLPPAHSMTVSRAGVRLSEYWSLDPSREVRLGGDHEYAEAFREVFTEAVRCRLRSAFPLGSLLSGGLDSSAVTCVARDLLSQKGELCLATFSAVFDEVTQCDERPFIDAVLAQDSVRPQFVHGDRLSPLADIDRVHWHQDEPLGAFNLFLNWALYGAAKEQGVRVLLDGFDEVTQCDERPFIDAVLAQDSVRPQFVHGDRLSPLADIDRVHWHQDEPLGAFNLFLNWALYGAAKEQGVRVLLDGFDGDTTVSHGIGYLSELASAGRWLTLATEVRGVAKNFSYSPWKPLGMYAWHYGLKPLVPQPLRRGGSLLRRRLRRHHGSVDRRRWSAYLNPEFVRRVGLVERRNGLRRSAAHTERQAHYRTLTQGVMPHILEVLDRAAAAFCIEPRYPFWDRRLVEFCLALPGEQKIRRGWTRMVMRRGLAGILPADVQWRPGKSNLGHNFDHGLLAFERNRLEDVIVNDPTSIEEYVDVAALREAHRRFVSRRVTNQDDVLAIWKAVTLSLWLRRAKAGVR